MNEKIKILANANYKRFCYLDGSDYIASEFALETILKLLQQFRLKKVLELGLGIGSICDTVLKFNHNNNLGIRYFGTENNDFCLSVLPKNVICYEHINLYLKLEEVEKDNFDFIIIDGSDESIKNIRDYCGKHAVIFIEGDRKTQTQTILDIFPGGLYVDVITLEKNPSYAHEGRSIHSYKGGGKLIFINPTIWMKIYWAKEKNLTFVKRKIRKIIK